MRPIQTLLAIFTMSAALTAAPVLTPMLTTSGSTIGWGFTVTPDPDEWISFIGSFVIASSGPSGAYTDFIGSLGGPAAGYLPPASSDWTVPDGLGTYAGPAADLTVRVLYERYSDDPNTCPSCFIDTSDLDVSLSAHVEAAPEPSTSLLMATCAVLLALKRCGRRSACRFLRRLI